jgi:membrane protein
VHWSAWKIAVRGTVTDVSQNHTLQMAAALSYYFVLAFFPAMILLSAAVAYLPIPDLFNQAVAWIARFLPGEAMGLVRKVLSDVVSPNKGVFLSFGLLGTLWSTSGGFVAIIEAFDIAYEVRDDRPIWKIWLRALELAFLCGTLMLVALFLMVVGPRFGDWLAGKIYVAHPLVMLWTVLDWGIAIGSTILAVEALYFLAPNVKQRFGATLPGALIAVASWMGLSFLLGLYFRHFGNFNKTYGTLGAAISLMMWLYWTGFALILGAELNQELAKVSEAGKVPPKCSESPSLEMDRAA